MPLTTLVRSILATLPLLVASLVLAAPASQAEPDAYGECNGYTYDPSTGGLLCNVGGSDSTPGSGGDSDAGGGSSGCFRSGEEIPCVVDTWSWSASRGCYVSAVPKNQWDKWSKYGDIPKEPPTDGAVMYYCTSSPGPGQFPPSDVFWAAEPPPLVTIDPSDVAELAIDRIGLQAIDMQLAPPPVSASSNSTGLVGLPVWMWTDPSATTWGPRSASASALGVTVTATVKVDNVDWNMGDGTVKTCGTGTPYQAAYGVERQSPTCGHVYQTTSRSQAGQSYAVTATSHWNGQWSGGGQSGDISLDLEDGEQLRIAEMQAIRIE